MFRRLPPRALLAWTGAALTALLTANLVAGDLAALHRRARSAGAEVFAVVALRDLPLGTTVGPEDVSLERRFSRHLPPRSLTAVSEATGRVVASPILAGSVVTDRHLAPRSRRGLDGIVPPGMRAVRVLAEDASQLSPGSVVDVLVTFDPGLVGPGGDPTRVVIRGALVVATDQARDRETGAGRAGVTLLTDPEGARRLAYATASGTITLALAPPEDACCHPAAPGG